MIATKLQPGRVYPGQAYTLQKPVASAHEMNVQIFKLNLIPMNLLSFN
ncbi:hypothetical protein ACJIZ3_019843 [Penstemon smallii]|uniref:Uncharacterized protein n=1 Tax=Penstemon smallii TaxID=265156 RepID=A0ABD3T365_9LAMI